MNKNICSISRTFLRSVLAIGILIGYMCGTCGAIPFSAAGAGSNNNQNSECPTPFIFGQDYLRVSIEYIYIPQKKNHIQGISLDITTKNKIPLDFKFAVPMPSNSMYSNLGQWQVIRYIALNEKTPLEVTEEIRTQSDHTGSFSWVPDFLKIVGGFVPGVSAITNLAGYAKTATDIVGAYDSHTTLDDVNRFMIFDKPLENQYDFVDINSELWFSVFTKGTGKFHVDQQAGQSNITIKEPGANLEGTTNILPDMDKDHKTMYKIQQCIKGTESTYYPTGKEPYIILKFEKYTPYPNLSIYPSSVPGVVTHFDNLNKIFKANPPVMPAASANKIFQTAVDTEGESLIATLVNLTNTGDLSLTDANIVIKAFIAKSHKYNNSYNSNYLNTINPFYKNSTD